MKLRTTDGTSKALFLVCLYLVLYFASTFLERPLGWLVLPELQSALPVPVPKQVPPAILLVLCAVRILFIVVITWSIARLDGRSLFDYGLRPYPTRQFVSGSIAGFVAISIVVFGLHVAGALEFTSWNVSGGAAFGFASIWAIGMLMVGISEEMAFRGAPIFLLLRVAPPWVPIAVSAAFFAGVHLSNEGENAAGIAQVALFGAVAAISVVRTGSLAFAIGLHAAWNWTLEFLYGAVGSGYTFQGHLVNQVVKGPTWLTGGSSGLEGSLGSFVVLVVIGTLLMIWPRRR